MSSSQPKVEKKPAPLPGESDESSTNSSDTGSPPNKDVESSGVKHKALLAQSRVAFRYVWADTKRHSRGFFVGLFTVFLVVFFVSLLQTAVTKSPFIFFKISENTAGENDLIMTPFFSISNFTSDGEVDVDVSDDETEAADPFDIINTFLPVVPLLNQSFLNESLEESDLVLGTSPRWLLIVEVSAEPLSDNGTSSSSLLLGIDSQLEEELGVGRQWTHPPLDYNECYISTAVARQAGLDPTVALGQNVYVTISFDTLASFAGFPFTPEAQAQLVDDLLVQTGVVTEEQLTAPLFDPSLTAPFVADLFDQIREQFPDADIDFDSLEAIITDISANQTVTIADLIDTAVQGFTLPAEFSQLLTISAVVDSPKGKWPAALGNIVVVDDETIEDWLTGLVTDLLDFAFGNLEALGLNQTFFDVLNLPVNFNQILGARRIVEFFLASFDLHEFALTSSVMYKNRLDAYLGTRQGLDQHMIEFSNAITDEVGVDFEAEFQIPIATALEATYFIRLFLDNIFASIVFLVSLLGVLLIYSLLLGDVESRTYEYGMLRALGMKQKTLVQVLLNKSLLFSVPGIAFGLTFAFFGNFPVSAIIEDYAAVTVEMWLSAGAVATAVSLGFIIPLIANIVPIRRALSKTLRDSLDVYHHVVSDVSVSIIKLSELGLDLWQTTTAILLVVIGFVVYYIIPLSFIFSEFGLFLAILSGILLGMLLGLALIAQTIQPFVEVYMAMLLPWGRHAKLLPIILKNLNGHRSRNAKTAQMFTICLAFVIFAGIMLSLQVRSIGDNIKVFVGADLQIKTYERTDPLDELSMTNYLEEHLFSNNPDGAVLGYTFVTFPLSGLDIVEKTRVSNLASFASEEPDLIGISFDFLEVTYNEFVLMPEIDSVANGGSLPTTNGRSDPVKLMYVDGGNARVALEEQFPTVYVPEPVLSGVNYNRVHDDDDDEEDDDNNAADTVEDGAGGYEGDSGGSTGQESQEFTHHGQGTGASLDDLEGAYTDYIDIILSEAYRASSGLDTNTPVELDIEVPIDPPHEDPHVHNYYLAKARAMVSKFPGFFFTSYGQAAGSQPALIRMDQYLRLYTQAAIVSNTTLDLSTGPPKQMLLVRFREDISDNQRTDVSDGLRNFYDTQSHFTGSAVDLVAETDDSRELLETLFFVVSVIAMVLCFFILWLSFQQNVKENAWEFGVLRALGLNTVEVTMLYVYEALAIVLTSLLLGSLVGIAIAISLTLQFNLFTEMPFQFEFPYALYFTLASMAICVSVAGSLWPALQFTRQSVSQTIRQS